MSSSPPEAPLPPAEAAAPSSPASALIAPEPAVRVVLRNGLAIACLLTAAGLWIAYGPTALAALTEGYPKGERTFELVRKEWAANWAFAATGCGAVLLATAEHFRRGKWMLAGALLFAAVVVLCAGIPDK